MKISPLLIILISFFLSQNSYSSTENQEAGEKLYKTYCVACHGANVGGVDMSKRIAPPIVAVRMRYIRSYPDKKSFIQAVAGWVEKQDENKSLMRGAVRKFKIMPPLTIPKKDAEKIAAYIYSGNLQKPEGFDQHMEDEHAKKGMQGMGMRGMGMQGQRKAMMGKMMQNRGMGMQKSGKTMHKMAQQLDLTPEQKQQMQPLMQQQQAQIKPLKNEIRKINQALRQLDTTNPNYKAQVFSLANDKVKRIYQIEILKGVMRQKIEAILNNEQRNKLNSLKKTN